MTIIENILKSSEQGITHLAEQTLQDFVTQATADGNAFLTAITSDLKLFTTQLQRKDITTEQFRGLIQNDKTLAEMVALKEEGLAQADLDKFVNGAISIIITAALAAIP